MPPREPHPQFPQLRAGVKDHARCQWEEIPPDGNPPWRAVEERNRVRELYSARPEQGFSIEGPHSCALSLELPGAERSGEGVQTKPQPRLYHSIQPFSGAGCLPRQDGCSYIATKGRTRYYYALPPKHISGTSCDGEGVCIFRSLVTTSPRIWCETRAWRELSELQSCDWAVQLA